MREYRTSETHIPEHDPTHETKPEPESTASPELEKMKGNDVEGIVEKLMKTNGADEMIGTLMDGLEEMREIRRERTDHLPETFEHLFSEVRHVLTDPLKAPFDAWLAHESKRDDSTLSVSINQYKEAERVETIFEKTALQKRFEQLLETLKKFAVDSAVLRRVEQVIYHLKQLQHKKEIPQPEHILKSFLLSLAWQKHEEQSEAYVKQNAIKKWLSKKPSTPEQAFKHAISQLDPKYRQTADKDGVTVEEKMLGSVPHRAFVDKHSIHRNAKRQDYRTHTEKFRSLLEGDSDVFDTESGTIETEGKAFLEIPKPLLPILGRKGLVKKLEFHTKVTSDKLGHFDKKTKTIALFHAPDLPTSQHARTLAHETGHAMRLEETLKLSDAIRFALEMNIAIVTGGYVSRYSAAAQEVYLDRMKSTVVSLEDLTVKEIDFLSDADRREEWAEMVAFTLTPSALHIMNPEKERLVRKYLTMFGVDVDEARRMMSAESEYIDDEMMKALSGSLHTAGLAAQLARAHLL